MDASSGTDRERRAAPDTIPKVRTHIKGLDEVLHGGFPQGRATVLGGGPGTGKTVFGLEFLSRAALEGEPGLFISFEEPAEALRRNARALGWDVEALEEAGRLVILDGRIDPAAIHAGEFDINGLLAILGGQTEHLGVRNVVIDAIDGLLRLLDDPRLEREQLEILHRWLLDHQLTVLLTMKTSTTVGAGVSTASSTIWWTAS